MILRLLPYPAFLAIAAFAAAPASADVLEVSSDGGAQWIAGPLVFDQPQNEFAAAQFSLAEVPTEALALVPEHAVANMSVQGAEIPAAFAAKVAELAARFDLSPALIEALVWQESRWQTNALSPVGARGLAQLMPGTARELGVDSADPFANLEGGARYLRQQLDLFDGNLEKALAAYNAGPGRVIRAGGIPRIRETQVYVASIMGRLADHSRSSD